MKVEITICNEQEVVHISEHTIDPLRLLYTHRFFAPVGGLSGFEFRAFVEKAEPDAEPDADLLAACKDMVELFTAYASGRSQVPWYAEETVAAARAVIAKEEKLE